MLRPLFRTRTIYGHGEFGSFLIRQRIALGLDVATVAKQAHIDPKYLSALEEERLEELPGRMYAYHFLRASARALQLAGQLPLLENRLTAAYQRPLKKTNELKRTYHPQPIVHPRRWNCSLWMIPVGICIVLLVVEIVSFIVPPQLVITLPQEPTHPLMVTGDTLLIQGMSQANQLEINGTSIEKQQKTFVHTVSLLEGLNPIVISGKNRFGTKKSTKLFVYYPGKNETVAIRNSTRDLN